jgi:quercetin dioxygenase-like cupin family protein
MATTEAPGTIDALFGGLDGKSKKAMFFNIQDAPWIKIVFDRDAPGAEDGYPKSILEGVDLVKYYQHGMEVQPIDCGGFNILQVRVAPGYYLARHKHNVDQLVFVMEGCAIQGNKELLPGEGWFTPANNPYSLVAGPQGLTWMEIRTEPLASLTTTWLEDDPARWVHRSI